jgi:hypothetical protein
VSEALIMSSFRPGVWDGEAALLERPEVAWLWQGYLAAGKITLLTSLWKSGKTTLVSLLLAARHHGGGLAGLPVRPGVTAVISEEDDDLWAERRRRLDFGGKACFFCQPFDRRPTFDEWLELLDHLHQLRRERGLDLVVVDTLISFLPGRNENNAVVVQEGLQPLRKLSRAGVAVLLLHHPRRGDPPLGQAARGSGAFDGFPEICLEMRHPGGDPFTRRRLLHALSRIRETPRSRVIELNAAGTDYEVIAEAEVDDFRGNWDVVLMVLEEAHHPLTRREMLAAWPADFPKPAEATLWKWLSRAAELGLARMQGSGRRSDPFRYWLPSAEAKWRDDPLHQIYKDQQMLDQLLGIEQQKEWLAAWRRR